MYFRYLSSSYLYPMWIFLLRQDTKYSKVNLRRLAFRNKAVGNPIVAPHGPVVSVTTYGKRVHTVHLTLESIGDGLTLPSRIILWVDDRQVFNDLPRSLRNLQERGLEIKFTENFGPHTKYYPYLESTETFDTPLVTADDDTIYPKGWLRGLINSFNSNGAVVSCYRAHVMEIVDGKIAPYCSWKRCRSAKPSFLNFATGVSGCIYPPALLRELKNARRAFEKLCPKADDVWLHVNAVRSGFQIKQIGAHSLVFPFVPDTQDVALYLSNASRSQNDLQISHTYTPRDIDFLASNVLQANPCFRSSLRQAD
jgi:hypothetical protein